MKRVFLSLLLLSVGLQTACEKESGVTKRRAGGTVAPADGNNQTPTAPNGTTPGSLNWDGQADRADTVWGF